MAYPSTIKGEGPILETIKKLVLDDYFNAIEITTIKDPEDYIIHAQIGNCVVKSADMPGYGDLHPRFGFPNGENDVDEVVDYLRVPLQIGFLNDKKPPIVSFEIKPFGDEDPDIVIANAKRTLNEAWARV
jgi:hypothetical protein